MRQKMHALRGTTMRALRFQRSSVSTKVFSADLRLKDTTSASHPRAGSRYVRPPIIHADVSRPAPMTVREFALAQGLTDKPVKGMLTGPVTMLNWAFPRVDVPRAAIAMQLARAVRAEVADLEKAGCRIVQARACLACCEGRGIGRPCCPACVRQA